MSNLFAKYKELCEAAGSTLYTAPGTGYTARVVSKNGKHVAKFFKDGQHMQHSDYDHTDLNDVHEFAREEMAFRLKEAKNPVNELSTELLKSYTDKVREIPVSPVKTIHTAAKHLIGKRRATDRIELDALMKKRQKMGLATEDVIAERINMPQGHKESADPISDDSATRIGRKKTQMGTKTPSLEIIAKILAGDNK